MNTAAVSKFARFAGVGGTGFVVDTGLTLLLIHRGIDPYTSRVFGIMFAMITTWRLNRALTFGASRTSQTSEGARYFIVAILAAMLSYAIYASLLIMVAGFPPALAIVIAVGTTTLVSFFGYSRFAFRTAA
ncbi:MAG: GtrA family protein [Hyphomonadaceae bacterium]|nr:GtrA family protein [Hyphomonadaceae bacterium]